MKTKSFWIPLFLLAFAAGLLLATRAEPATYVGCYVLVEAGLFALAFVMATLLGGAGKVHALGAVLGVGFAIVSAALFGEDCGEDDIFVCFSAEVVFVWAMAAVLAVYPGWALGARLGASSRGTSSP